jgi:omega-hydroxy-beta-dihydromenaquinone-9 sulfotransferase
LPISTDNLSEAPSSGHVDVVEPRRPLLHLLAGANLASLARILSRRGALSPRSYAQIAIILVGAVLRWPGCTIEALRVARRVEAVSFDPPPVFIVGHWRSGTTLLHNLMSRDPGFCFPTIVDVLRPYDFYPNPFDFITSRIVLRFIPRTRPMDDVRIDPESPQEEELALATMGAPSFFNCIYFPREMTSVFAEEVLFAGADDETLRLWREALRYYLAKLVALNPSRRLLLKNPAHSTRIPHLLALFPGAKFIHIHRDPSAVFHSMRKFYHRMLPILALQDYRPADIDAHILWAYPNVMNRLLDSLAELPPERAIAVRYGELVADPANTLKRIYRDLNLGDFERVKYAMGAYAQEHLHGMPPTPTLDQQTASRLALDWGPVYTRLGYPSPACVQSG